MKAFTKRIFGAVEPRYLTRAYLISLALLIYAIWYFATQATLQPHQRGIMLAYAALSAILFPFAKLVWDEIRDTIMGNTVLSWPAVASCVAKPPASQAASRSLARCATSRAAALA